MFTKFQAGMVIQQSFDGMFSSTDINPSIIDNEMHNGILAQWWMDNEFLSSISRFDK
jgi:hypothetical protein